MDENYQQETNIQHASMLRELNERLINIEQKVANHALTLHAAKVSMAAEKIKSQAAATQATEHLYAPLRSDTKPLLEMSELVRRVARVNTIELSDAMCAKVLTNLAQEANDILKRST